jgi:hypothetical protein
MGTRLRLEEPSLAGDLLEYLRERDCPAALIGPGTIEVELPHALHTAQAQMELELYLRVWRALRRSGVAVLE